MLVWTWLGAGADVAGVPRFFMLTGASGTASASTGSATASTGAASAAARVPSASAGVAVDLDLEMPLAPVEAVSASESNSRHLLRGSLTLKASFRCGFKYGPCYQNQAAEIRGSAHKFLNIQQ